MTCTKAFNKRNNITERWVDRLTGKKPQDVESFLTDKGFAKSITNQNSPKTSHILLTRTTGNGDVDVLDFHPGGGMEVSIGRFIEMEKFKGELGRLILKISTEFSMAPCM